MKQNTKKYVDIEMPAVIADFFEATKKYDKNALFKTFRPDIKMMDEGKSITGKGIEKWNDELFFGVKVTLKPLSIRYDKNRIIIPVILDGDYSKYNIFGPFNYEGRFEIENDLISYMEFKEQKK